jgi:hybrid cluster-associated redox disulfide protein
MEITKDTKIEELLNDDPALSKIFIELGLPCLVCGEAFWGTIEELAHQNNVAVDKVIRELNKRKKGNR